MAIIDYNHSNSLDDEQRLNSLRDSVQRAVDELTNLLSNKAEKSNISGTDRLAEYPIEVGTKDGWRYKRYNTGFVEMWSKKQVSFGSAWTSINGQYRATAHISLPLVIPFENRLSVIAQSTVSGIIITGNIDNTTLGTDKIEVAAFKNASGTATYTPNVSLYVSGML